MLATAAIGCTVDDLDRDLSAVDLPHACRKPPMLEYANNLSAVDDLDHYLSDIDDVDYDMSPADDLDGDTSSSCGIKNATD